MHDHDHDHHHEGCSCGCHDHGHHHHDHHGHEHDHDHGHDRHEHEHTHTYTHSHEHDHDDPGHQHEHHDHGHEHHHDHDHEHHHHHAEAIDGVTITTHETSMIGAMSGKLRITDYDEAERALSAAMRELGRRVDEAGGLVGHIKFLVASQGRWAQISVTDDEESVRRFDGPSCSIEGVAIVFSLEEEELRAMMKETIGALIEG